MPLDFIAKAHTWLPDGAKVSGLQKLLMRTSRWVYSAGVRMPKWKSWYTHAAHESETKNPVSNLG